MSDWLKAVDAYDHLVAIHIPAATTTSSDFDRLLGIDAFDGTSFQAKASEVRG